MSDIEIVGQNQPSEDELIKLKLIAISKYLLYERQQETQLQIAFRMLVQERHQQFHTKGNRKDGDGTEFIDCDNEICKNAKAILDECKSMSVDINPLTLELTQSYNLRFVQAGTNLKAWLELDKKSSLVIPGQ